MIRRHFFAFYLLLGGLFPGFCLAATMGVSPIHFHLSAQQTRDVLTITNKGNELLIVEIKPYLWLIKNKKDVYLPTQDIFVGPPVAKIMPQQSQLIRLALIRQPLPNQQLKYRIYVQEIVPRTLKTQGVQVRLRIGIPVYVAPSA